jgi:pyruvate-ferredoxin/flavodoxin oxidoreductase
MKPSVNCTPIAFFSTYTSNAEGRGPAWSNSLFEDNAEFGLGMRLALDQRVDYAQELLRRLASQMGERLVSEILEREQSTEAGIASQRQRVAEVKRLIAGLTSNDARDLIAIADGLVRKSVWLLGGDGWPMTSALADWSTSSARG